MHARFYLCFSVFVCCVRVPTRTVTCVLVHVPVCNYDAVVNPIAPFESALSSLRSNRTLFPLLSCLAHCPLHKPRLKEKNSSIAISRMTDPNLHILTYDLHLCFTHELDPTLGKNVVTQNAATLMAWMHAHWSVGILENAIKDGRVPMDELALSRVLDMLRGLEKQFKDQVDIMVNSSLGYGTLGMYNVINLFAAFLSDTSTRLTTDIEKVINAINESLPGCETALQYHETFLEGLIRGRWGMPQRNKRYDDYLFSFHEAICRELRSRLENLPRAREFLQERLDAGHELVYIHRRTTGDYLLRVSPPRYYYEVKEQVGLATIPEVKLEE